MVKEIAMETAQKIMDRYYQLVSAIDSPLYIVEDGYGIRWLRICKNDHKSYYDHYCPKCGEYMAYYDIEMTYRARRDILGPNTTPWGDIKKALGIPTLLEQIRGFP